MGQKVALANVSVQRSFANKDQLLQRRSDVSGRRGCRNPANVAFLHLPRREESGDATVASSWSISRREFISIVNLFHETTHEHETKIEVEEVIDCRAIEATIGSSHKSIGESERAPSERAVAGAEAAEARA